MSSIKLRNISKTRHYPIDTISYIYTKNIQEVRNLLSGGVAIVVRVMCPPGVCSDGHPVRAGDVAARKRQLRVSISLGWRFYL